MRHRWPLNPLEFARFSELWTAHRHAQRELVIAFTMLAAQHSCDTASVVGLENGVVVVDVPDVGTVEDGT